MALNSLPGAGMVTPPSNRVYRATQSGTYTVDIKPGVYRVTRQATTNIIIGSTTIIPSTTPSMVFINTPQTSITFNSTVSQQTVPWVTQPNVNVSLRPGMLYYDPIFNYYMVGADNDPTEWTISTDAITWVRFTQPGISENYFYQWNRPVRLNNDFIISGGRFSQLAGGPPILYSTTGRSWSKYNASVPGSGNWNYTVTAASNGTGTVVMGGLTSNNQGWIIWSTDPTTNTTWGGGNLMPGEVVQAAVFGNGKYVMGGSAGSMRVSTNGTTWVAANPNFGAQSIRDITYAAGKYVAVGHTGIIRTSTDAVTWDIVTSGWDTQRQVTDVYYASHENIFVAVAAGWGEIRISTDAVTWQARTMPVGIDERSFAYGQGKHSMVQDLGNDTFNPFTTASLLTTVSTVPFVDTYIILDFKGEIATLA